MVSLCVILHSKIRNQIGKLFFPTRARPVRRHSGTFPSACGALYMGLCMKKGQFLLTLRTPLSYALS